MRYKRPTEQKITFFKTVKKLNLSSDLHNHGALIYLSCADKSPE